MQNQPDPQQQAFLQAFRGSFTSALRWHHLDALWKRLGERAENGWYIYAVGEPPPDRCADREQLLRFIEEIDALLRKEHKEDYCGIVYADNLKQPTFIKIYDPHNLGVSCGFSDNPPLPGWILSTLPPCDLATLQKPTASRRRWWQRLFDS
jgi:hypothetical protein